MPRATNAVTKQDLEQLGAALTGEIRGVREDVEKVAVHLVATNVRLDAAVARLHARLDGTDRRLDKVEDAVHNNGVLIEKLETNLRAGIEGCTAATEALGREMTEVERRLGQRITALEQVVRSHSVEVHKLTDEVAELRARFDRRDFDSLEQRVSSLEKQLAGR